MHAIILAAGVGRRLAGVTDSPKCLLRFGGASLLERQLAMLAEAGVERLTVVTGFAAMRIEQALAVLAPRIMPELAVTTVFNPDFRRGSVLSCLAAAPALESGEDVLLMDADVLCDARMVIRLTESAHANCFLFDRDFVDGDEPVKLCVRAGQLVEFRKSLPQHLAYETIGESVGFFRLAAATAARLTRRCRQYRRQGDGEAPHEEALRDLLLAQPLVFGYEDVTGLPWIEIDFPEDVTRANDRVLPRLCRQDALP